MKILAFADTHGSIRSAREIIKLAPQVELLVCIGDFTNFGLYGDLFLERIQHLNLPMLVVSGNHEEESPGLLEKLGEQFHFIKNLENQVEYYQQIAFCGCSYSAATIKRSHYLLTKLAIKVKDAQPLIFLTHSPPANSPVAYRNNRDAGSQQVFSFIEEIRPDFVLCGHIHQPEQRESRIGKSHIINVACQYRILEI